MGLPYRPESEPSSSQFGPGPPSYRQVRQLPSQLLDHCTVCIEEQLFSQAIPLLSSAITAGNGTARPAYVPPIQHLSLLATLVVHPSMTTRTTSKEKQTASDDALRYLRHLNSLTSAEDSGLTKALQFTASNSSRSKRARTRKSDANGSDDDNDDPGRIRSNYANRDSLFTTAEDFWAIVGWAFNCSITHPPRWSRWKLWLSFMLDVLSDDLEHKHRQSNDPSERLEAIKTSLLATYLAPYTDTGRNPKRRLMRAILADGTPQSLSQFPSIYEKETNPPKQPKSASELSPKKRTLDLEQGDFGDYFDSDSDSTPTKDTSTPRNNPSTSTTTTRRSASARSSTKPSRPSSPNPNPTTPTTSYGGPTSLSLRARFLHLLTHLSALTPTLFLDSEDLFDLYTEFLRPLPLPVFSAFVFDTTSDPHARASLLRMLLRPLLSGAAPISDENALTVGVLVRYYAPFAANVGSVVENARVAVCVEGLGRLLFLESGGASVRERDGNELDGDGLGGSQLSASQQSAGGGGLARDGEFGSAEVRFAVEKGIEAREAKAAFHGDSGRKSGGRKEADGEAWEALEASGERMRALLDMI